MTRRPRRVAVRHLVEGDPIRLDEDTRTDDEKLEDAIAEEAELRTAGVRVERFQDVVVYGRQMLRHIARTTRSGDRAERRTRAGFAPDPLRAALEEMPHKGRAWYVARRLGSLPSPTPAAEAAARGHREDRAARRAALAERREWAHAAGYRRISRWMAAGAPVIARPGRTPYRSGS